MKKGLRIGEPFPIIRTYDPAIDWDAVPALDMNEFLRSRDPKIVEPYMHAGERPVVYWCRPVTDAQKRELLGYPDEARHDRTFSLCVMRVEHLFVDDGSNDGAGSRESWSRQHDGPKPRPLSDGVMAKFSFDDVQHVGQVTFAASFCSPDRPLYVPLRGTCLDATTAAELSSKRRRAAATSDTGNSTGDKPRAVGPSPEAQSV